MKAIVVVDLNWGIGYKGKLLEKIPEDMKYFKQLTLNKVVVMGRETFESLPNKEPLKDRINIVLSRKKFINNKNIIICNSIKELLKEIEKYSTDDIFVIGGEQIYSQLISYCNEVYVTKIQNKYIADKFMVNLDSDKQWELVYKSEVRKFNEINYSFTKYKNKGEIIY